MLPTQIGPYQIRSRLGRGGMGEVFEAIDPATGETVAVKSLRSHLVDDPSVRQRFESEIEALKNLRHPGIVRMLAFGAEDDEPYFAMEFVRGRSLEQVLRAGRRFTWRETVTVAGEVARALKAAHDLGIIHRDLKPANLLVFEPAAAAPGAPVSVKLADFGIAKLFGGVAHTAHNHVVGTAEFMAPEQAAGRPLDHRADLYALGLVMYAMMTGSSPFRGTQLTEIIEKQRNAVPPRLAGIVKDIPAELDALIARLLAKDPAQRPASALALSRLLSAVETLYPPGDAMATPKVVSVPDKRPRPADAATAVRTDQPTSRGPTAAGGRPAAGTDRKAANGPPRPQHPTAPATAGQRRAASPPTGAPDPLAATQPRAVPPRQGTVRHRPSLAPAAPTGGSTAETEDLSLDGGRAQDPATAPSRLSTDIASAKTLVDENGSRNRFTTILELERAETQRRLEEQRRQHLWNALTIAVLLAAFGFGARWLFRRPTADELHASITRIAADEHSDLRDASDSMEAFLERFPDDPRAGRVRELKLRVELDSLERRARRRLRGDAIVKPIERDYRAAMSEEENGPSACLKALEAMLAVYETKPAGEGEDSSLWLELARRQVQRLIPRAADEQRDDAEKIALLLGEAKSLADRAGIANDPTARGQFVADARKKYETVIQVYEKRPHAAEGVAEARRGLERLDLLSPSNSDTPAAKP